VFYPGLSITAAGSVNVEYQFGSTSGTVPAGSTSEIFVDPTSPLMLTATPTSLLYSFDGWSGASASGASSISLLVGEPQSITASSGYNYIPIVVIAALGGSIAVAWVVRGNRKKPANSPRLVGSQSA
jgi:hypothetical protein